MRKHDGERFPMKELMEYVTIDITILSEHISVDARSRAVTAETSNIYLEDCEYHKGYCELQDKTFVWRVSRQVCYGFGLAVSVDNISSNSLLLFVRTILWQVE